MLKKASRILVAFVFAFGPNLVVPNFVEAATGIPSAPDSISVTAGPASVSISWATPKVSTPTITGYQVDYSKDGLSWTTERQASQHRHIPTRL